MDLEEFKEAISKIVETRPSGSEFKDKFYIWFQKEFGDRADVKKSRQALVYAGYLLKKGHIRTFPVQNAEKDENLEKKLAEINNFLKDLKVQDMPELQLKLKEMREQLEKETAAMGGAYIGAAREENIRAWQELVTNVPRLLGEKGLYVKWLQKPAYYENNCFRMFDRDAPMFVAYQHGGEYEYDSIPENLQPFGRMISINVIWPRDSGDFIHELKKAVVNSMWADVGFVIPLRSVSISPEVEDGLERRGLGLIEWDGRDYEITKKARLRAIYWDDINELARKNEIFKNYLQAISDYKAAGKMAPGFWDGRPDGQQ